jgi:putative tricarboxylic transport membrane protein
MDRIGRSGVLVGAVAAAVLAWSIPGTAWAQAGWKPERHVEIIVGTGPGSGVDRMARTIQQIWRDRRMVESPTTIITRAGGGGAVGWAYLNEHAGDGHYLMVGAGNLSIGYMTGTAKIGYRDVTPISMLFHEYIALTVRADSPIRDGRDLIARLRKDPASVSLGVSSVAGSTTHIAAAMVFKEAGVNVPKIRTVIFGSAGKSMTAMLGGHVDLVSGSMSGALNQFRNGKVRIVGYAAARRLGGDLADVPTWREQGVDVQFSNYRGMIGPRELGAAQIAYWEDVFEKLDRDESWRADLEKNSLDRDFMKGRETRAYLDGLAKPIRAVLEDLALLK